MSALRVAVIAGTSDATDLITSMPKAYAVTAFAATEYGKNILDGIGCDVHMGRLDAAGFMRILCHFDAVVDASHPFAVVVTDTVKQVCHELHLPYFRLGRPRIRYAYERICHVASKEEAAARLSEMPGNLLLTTGVNTLSFYESHVCNFAERAWVRVLDTPESRCLAFGSCAHILYAIPPFSVEDTEALLRKYDIAVLVTKDSGTRGGLPQKLEAAKRCHIPVVLIGTPPQGITQTGGQILASLKKLEQEEVSC